MLFLYGSAIYAKQYASVKNKIMDMFTNGIFHEEEIGLRFYPLEHTYHLTSWFWITPNLYFTTGIRYSEWIAKDITLNSNSSYLGIGYSF
ncbi:hypothetical protein [Sulfurimonas sp.]|uniref:hypothetical protein n=1 Tax=Sulfurimonas sp. TaxID=2022749 RepID=UPI002612C8BA|nr:hypothetical protein [Sulfurimonas sp.]